MVHFNPKKILPYHPPGTKPDKKIGGLSTSIESIFLKLFLKLDDDIKIMKCLDIGSTCCIVYIAEEEDELTGFKQKKKVIYCTFLGDVQCIVISKTKAKKLSKIHNILNFLFYLIILFLLHFVVFRHILFYIIKF